MTLVHTFLTEPAWVTLCGEVDHHHHVLTQVPLVKIIIAVELSDMTVAWYNYWYVVPTHSIVVVTDNAVAVILVVVPARIMLD